MENLNSRIRDHPQSLMYTFSKIYTDTYVHKCIKIRTYKHTRIYTYILFATQALIVAGTFKTPKL
jgi:hypothetical protein